MGTRLANGGAEPGSTAPFRNDLSSGHGCAAGVVLFVGATAWIATFPINVSL